MFEQNHIDEFDLKMKSILDGGQEEIPAGIWEGVSAGLDKVARRRKAALWLRYSSISAIAAAVIAAVFVFNRDIETDIVSAPEKDMIAVVEEASQMPQESEQTLTTVLQQLTVPQQYISMADIPEKTTETGAAAEELEERIREAQVDHQVQQTSEHKQESREDVRTEDEITGQTAGQITWEDDEEKERRHIRTSIILSGIAGTNSPQNKAALKPLRSPGIFKAPEKTTVEQVGSERTYGIPVSLGVGVKFELTKRWSVGAGLNYTYLSSSFSGKYTEVENGVPHLPLSERIKSSLHYVGIPVNAYYNIISRDYINFYAYAGGTVEKCVKNIYEVQTTPIINHSEPVQGVQLSANAGMGVEFLLGSHIGIYLDPSLRYYFNCNQPKSIRTAQPLMLGFEAGIRLIL